MSTLDEDISVIKSLHRFLNLIIHNIDTNQKLNEKAISKLAEFTRNFFNTFSEDNSNEELSDMEPDVDDDDLYNSSNEDDSSILNLSNSNSFSSLASLNVQKKEKKLCRGEWFEKFINNKINNEKIVRYQKGNLNIYNQFKNNTKMY